MTKIRTPSLSQSRGGPKLEIKISHQVRFYAKSITEKNSEQFFILDTFVKISAAVEFGAEFWRCKTDVVKAASEPQYDFSSSVQVK